MENSRLRIFRAVADHLSFRRAAEELHLSQPAVTLQIKALEDELRLRLFDRTGNRVKLTAAGRLLQVRAREIAEILAKTTEKLASMRGEQCGQLRAGASTSIAQYVLPKLLGGFKRENPQVELAISSGNTEAIVDWLVEGRIEIGLIEGPALRKDVHTEPFMEDEIVLLFPTNHPWRNLSHLTVEHLRRAPLLLRERGSGTRRALEAALRKAGFKSGDLDVVMELDTTEGIISSVESGLGIGFVSRCAVTPRLPLGTIATAPIKGLPIRRHFSLIYPEGPKPEGMAGLFRKFTIDHARETFPRLTVKKR